MKGLGMFRLNTCSVPLVPGSGLTGRLADADEAAPGGEQGTCVSVLQVQERGHWMKGLGV